MKKVTSKTKSKNNIDILPEYFFKDRVRGKYYERYMKGRVVKINSKNLNNL
jgi:hypothetical protein